MSGSFLARCYETLVRAGRRRWLATAVKVLIVLVVLWFIRRFVADAWAQLSQHQIHISFAWLALAGGFYLAGTFPLPCFGTGACGPWVRRCGWPMPYRAYYIGHLGKHVPGKAMVVIIRASLIRGPGVNGTLAVASVFLETLTMMAVGALIAGGIVAVWLRESPKIAIVAASLAVVAGLPTLPPIFRRLVRLAGVLCWLTPPVSDKLDRLGWRTMASGWILNAIGWAVLGLSYWAVLEGLGLARGSLIGHFYVYVASVSFATVSGFVSMVPGGIAVREAALTELTRLMIPTIGGGMALVSTILLRFVWFVSELAISGMLYAVGWGKGITGSGTRD